MASTYTTNIGIEKPATGDQSGTWGDTTNTNFDIIDQGTNGVAVVTLASAGTSGSPNSLPISNGALSDGRNRFIEFNDGADLGATAYVQLDPNDAEKIVHIRNSLSGSRSLILFQGAYNASNDFEVPNGADVLVKFDGGGTGATVTDVNVNLTPTKLTTNTISSTDTNGNLTIDPNGTGDIVLDANVGIGTTSPTGKLNIAASNGDGFEFLPSNTTDTNWLQSFDRVNGSWVNQVSAALSHQLYTNGSERMRIDSSGQVGIGTSSPLAKFHVDNTNSAFYMGYGGNEDIYLQTTNGNVLFTNKAATTEYMRITSAGSVGIGTTSPSSYGRLAVMTPTATFGYFGIGNSVGGGGGVNIAQYYGTTKISYIDSTLEDGTPSSEQSRLQFATISGGTLAERMRIDHIGQVGLSGNTTSFNTTGSVNGLQLHYQTSSGQATIGSYSSGGGTALAFHTNTGGGASTEAMRIDSSGSVGIGVTPGTFFDVGNASSNTVARVRNLSGGGTNTNATLQLSTANNYVSLLVNEQFLYSQFQQAGGLVNHYSDVDNHIFRNKAGSEAMRILSDGKVAIGSTSSLEELRVVGNIEVYNDDVDGYIWFHDNGTRSWSIGSDYSTGNFAITNQSDLASGHTLEINSSGQVGIGTASPSGGVQLDVRGAGVLQLVNTDTVQLLASSGGSTLKNVSNNPLIFGTNNTERMRIAADGKVGIGRSPSYVLDILCGNTTALQAIRVADTSPTEYFGVFNANEGGQTPNAANAVLKVRGMITTSRSINAGGTVNASGADYAEYMTKADGCGTIAKGAVCGVDADGKLTDVFANAHSFVIKSTDPSYVGGDVWSIASTDADGNQTTLEGDALEAARQKVDRIAFSGQVPCTISGTTEVGDFVIAQAKSDGGIEAVAVTSPTFEQYSVAIGKVWKLGSSQHTVAVKIG